MLPSILQRAARWLERECATDPERLLRVLERNGRARNAFGPSPSIFVRELSLPSARITTPSARLHADVLAAEQRLGARLPASLIELWCTLDECPSASALLDAVLRPRINRPRQLLTPPRWATDSKLACAVYEDGSSCDAREYFRAWTGSRTSTYQELFEAARDEWKISPERPWQRWAEEAPLMLPIDFVENIVLIASDDEFNHVVVTDLRDERGESPWVCMSNACEGAVFRRGNDAIEWVEAQLEEVAADVVSSAT